MTGYADLSQAGVALGQNSTKYVTLSSAAASALTLQGATSSDTVRLSGINDPASSMDAVNLQYLQQYVLGQIRGLSIKPSASLCATVPTSLALTSATLAWAGPFASGTNNYNLATTTSSSGAAWPTGVNPFASNFTILMKINSLATWAIGGAITLCSFAGQSIYMDKRTENGGDWMLGFGSDAFLNNGSNTYIRRFWQHTDLDTSKQYYLVCAASTTTGSTTLNFNLVYADTLTVPATTHGDNRDQYKSAFMNISNWQTAPAVAPYHLSIGTGSGSRQTAISEVALITSYKSVAQALAVVQEPPSGIVDGVPLTQGMRVLLTAQASAIDNGIYVVGATTMTRAPDLAATSTASGSFIFIDGTGVTNNSQGYVCNALPGTDIVGTHSLLWTIFTSEDGHIGTTTIQGGLITDASGQISFLNNHLVTSGNVSATKAQLSTLVLQSGQISDSSGALSFGGTILSTTGSVSASSLAASNCSTGTLKIASGSLTDTSGQISLASTSMSTTGNLAASHFVVSSDARLKSNITQLQVSLEDLDKLDGHAFRWISTDLPDTGLIAQEVMSLAPEAVIIDPRTGMFAVDYARMVPYLIRWLKLLSEKM